MEVPLKYVWFIRLERIKYSMEKKTIFLFLLLYILKW